MIKDRLKTIPNDIAILAKSHFDGNFTRQGFDGVKWQEVQRRLGKGKGRDATRAILSGKTKTLAKSIYIKSASLKRIVIASSSKYGEIHNNGGTINKKESSKILHFRNVEMDYNKKTKKHGQGTKFSSYKRAHYSQKVNIGAHSIVMPQRKFLGNSQVLNKKILNLLNKVMK